MRLLHYSRVEIHHLEIMPYNQNTYDWEGKIWQTKPVGLWLSLNDDWKQWCLSENFMIEDLKYEYEVFLHNNANILYLHTPKELFSFTQKYPFKYESDRNTRWLDWNKVKEEYQGIIIPKYLCECRLSRKSSWYYGWDCASGCIWDITCIKEFKKTE